MIGRPSVPLGNPQFQQRHGLEHCGIAFTLACGAQDAFGDGLHVSGVDGMRQR